MDRIDSEGKNIKQADTGIPMFINFDISVCGLCNRKCPFCPRSNRKLFPNIKEYLDFGLFLKILEELKSFDYKKTLAFSGFSEPLLHNDLIQMVKKAREYCPDITLIVVTNGDLLSVARLKELFGNGLTKIMVSLYDGPHQIATFQKMMEEARLTEKEFVIRKRYTSEGIKDYRSIPGFLPTNRGGVLQDKIHFPDSKFSELGTSIKRVCYYPFYFIMLDYNGDVLLCTHDWGKKLIIGNLNSSTIYELWNSEKMMEVRRTLKNNSRDFEPCNKCNIEGTLKGKEIFQQWCSIL